MKAPTEFWSIENMEKHVEKVYGRFEMIPVGEKLYGPDLDHKTVYLMDPEGRGWYETRVLIGGRWATQEEAAIGRQKKRKRRSA